jgi:hypothetical protein
LVRQSSSSAAAAAAVAAESLPPPAAVVAVNNAAADAKTTEVKMEVDPPEGSSHGGLLAGAGAAADRGLPNGQQLPNGINNGTAMLQVAEEFKAGVKAINGATV